MPDAETPTSLPKAAGKARLAALLLPLLLLAAAAFYPAFRAGYTNWDDPAYTFQNPLVQNFSAANLKHALTTLRVANYHPLTDISLAAESAVLGERAAVHHAGNLLLHALNAGLLFLLALLLAGEPWAAFWAALLWAVHPAQAESVCWLAERKNLLYSFFYFAAVLAYVRRARTPGRAWTAAAWLFFLASLFSKASAVTLPLVFLLLDFYFKTPSTRRALLEKAAFFLAAGLFAALSAAAQGENGRILPANPLPLFAFYLIKVFWPAELSALYPYAETSRYLAGRGVLYLAPVAIFAAALWAALKKDRLAAFGLLFFLVNLLPFLILIPIGPSYAADRYLYMPLAGLAIAAAAAGLRLCRPFGLRGPLLALAALAACLALSRVSLARAAVWTSSLTLWKDAAARYPGSGVIRLNLAEAELAGGSPAAAEALLVSLLKENPKEQKALYNLGTLYAMSGRYVAAENLLKRSLALKPGDAPAWNNLGLAELNLGRAGEARKALLTATAADPAYAPAYANLAETERRLGLKSDAARHRGQFLALSGAR